MGVSTVFCGDILAPNERGRFSVYRGCKRGLATIKEKNQGFNRKNVSSFTWKVFECDMEFCYKNIFKIRNVTFIFQYFEKQNENIKAIAKTPMDSVKSMNLFEIKKDRFIGELFFHRFVHNFSILLI